jgi:hypothetical protein
MQLNSLYPKFGFNILSKITLVETSLALEHGLTILLYEYKSMHKII